MHRTLLAGALALSCPMVLHANDAGTNDQTASAELDPVLVTANRTALPQEQTLAATTVITRADIERSQARSVRELLRRSPGIAVANQGGPGKLTSIRMRGTESDHTLVLIDGVRYNSASSGLPAIQDLPVAQIERIEIVRGPRASLYGSDAIGGVIQIFTRRGDDGDRPHFSIGGGRYGTYEGQVGVSGGNARSHYSVNISATDTDGFNACTDTTACFTDEPDDDGYNRTAGSMRFGYRFDNGLKLDLHALRTEGENEFDGTPFGGNESDTLRQVVGVKASGKPADIWRTSLALNRSRDESANYFDGQFVNAIDSVRDSVDLKNELTLNPGDLVTFGIDYRNDRLDSTTDYQQTKRDNIGAYLQYLGRRGAHELQLAGRGDDNEQFGEHATGSAAWGWNFSSTHKLILSYGTAFKAPTFDVLYFPGFSNPDLDPEKSRTAEIGLRGRPEWGRWSINAYETDVDDLIDNVDTNGDGFVDTPRNVEEARVRGLETQIGTTVGAWRIDFNATWLDAENRGDDADHGNELPRRPELSGQVAVDRDFGRYGAGLTLFAAGSTYDDVANTRRLDGYELVDLRGEYRFAPDWRVQARISNLLDEEYESAAFYEQPGRALFITLRYQP